MISRDDTFSDFIGRGRGGSLQNDVWMAGLQRRGSASINRQQKSLMEEFASAVSQGFTKGIGIAEAFDGFTNFHMELDADELQELAQQVFAWLTESFSMFAENFTGNLDAVFCKFVELHQLDEATAQSLADYICRAASVNDDYSDAITMPDETSQLDQDARLEKIRKFLMALSSNIGSGLQPLFPNLKIDKPDPYGNRAVGDVRTFDRAANRYGHQDDGGLQDVPNDNIARVVACLANMNRFWTNSQQSESPAESFRKGNKQTKDDE
jgi:hypothetical protein